MRFLLKTVEQHNYVAVVKDEEHSVCVAVVFCPKFKDTIFQMLDEFLIPTFGLLDVTQHIRYFYLRAFFKAVEEVLKISFVVCYLPCHVTKIRKVSIYRNFFERHGTPCPYNPGALSDGIWEFGAGENDKKCKKNDKYCFRKFIGVLLNPNYFFIN